jgi:hypothetical protein
VGKNGCPEGKTGEKYVKSRLFVLVSLERHANDQELHQLMTFLQALQDPE